MAYSLQDKLVIGVASSAMFDLTESDSVFKTEGEESYRLYQEQNVNVTLKPGIAFSFIKRLLSLNDLSSDPNNPLIEVILLSQNDPDTGLRVMNSIKQHCLNISRAIFLQGKAPYEYIPALNISLFLSANKQHVSEAIKFGYPAGQVLDSETLDEQDQSSLRIAFDFDGVLADDESETIMQTTKKVEKFHEYETNNNSNPHKPGPLQDFLVKIKKIQLAEEKMKLQDRNYKNRLRISIVTARSAPSHERALVTLKSWGVIVNDAFFLGGIDKGKVLEVLKPHIFFDDQEKHLQSSSSVVPSVHIPFGITNN